MKFGKKRFSIILPKIKLSDLSIPTMKIKFYAFVQFETGEVNDFGNCKDIGYVTESILKSNTKRNKRVKVYGSNFIKYVQRKKIITIIPQY